MDLSSHLKIWIAPSLAIVALLGSAVLVPYFVAKSPIVAYKKLNSTYGTVELEIYYNKERGNSGEYILGLVATSNIGKENISSYIGKIDDFVKFDDCGRQISLSGSSLEEATSNIMRVKFIARVVQTNCTEVRIRRLYCESIVLETIKLPFGAHVPARSRQVCSNREEIRITKNVLLDARGDVTVIAAVNPAGELLAVPTRFQTELQFEPAEEALLTENVRRELQRLVAAFSSLSGPMGAIPAELQNVRLDFKSVGLTWDTKHLVAKVEAQGVATRRDYDVLLALTRDTNRFPGR